MILCCLDNQTGVLSWHLGETCVQEPRITVWVSALVQGNSLMIRMSHITLMMMITSWQRVKVTKQMIESHSSVAEGLTVKSGLGDRSVD